MTSSTRNWFILGGNQTSSLNIIRLNHKSIEWLGFEDTLNLVLFQPSVMGRDTYYSALHHLVKVNYQREIITLS